MRVLFISDIHLQSGRDERARRFIDFLDREAQGIDQLVIAGDLFDFWVGMQKVIFYEYFPILAKLWSVREKGVRISYVAGNHDFFLAPFFSDVLGADVHEEELTLDLDGFRVLVLHGDQIDRRDYAYRLLRWFLRTPLIRHGLNFLPSSWLWAIGRWASRCSRNHSSRPETLARAADTFRQFAQGKFKEGWDAVVTGHIHRPELFETSLNGRRKLYLNAGDWVTHQSCIKFEGDRFSLH